jgi:amino acid adenylation domain-containing protein
MSLESSTDVTEFSSEENELLAYLLEQEGIAEYQQPEAIPHYEHSGGTVLSYEQQRLWYLEQLNPGSSVYTIAPLIHLKGPLQAEALQRGFQTIIQRHEILRTTFEEREGIPSQVVHAEWQLPFPVTDLRSLPAPEKQQCAEELALKDAQEPFDLSRLPLIRTQLVRLEEEEWSLLLTFHHIIFDGWSFGVFFQELSDCYRAYIKHEEPILETLSIQYADYAIWQREEKQQEVYASQREYWQKQLQGVPAVLDLPKDYSRPLLSNFAGDRLPVHVDALRTGLLRKLAQQEGCSLYMVILAAWFALLHRYSGQEELVVGTPIANRANLAQEKLIGFFINTLALRVFTGDDPSFRDLLRRVRDVTIQAYEHRDLPFEQVVGLAHPSRELNHMPLVQVGFSFQTRKKKQLQLPGVEAEFTYRRTMSATFDVQLDLTEENDELSGLLDYSSELFTQKRIQRMIGHLNTLFSGIISNPQQRLNSLPLLTDAEEQQLLIEWNQTQTAYPQTRCLTQLIEEQVARTPEAVALIFAGQRLTYRELNSRSNQLAHYLQETGVGPDVLVGVCLYRSVEMLVALLAVLKAGGAYVPLDPDYPKERLAFILAETQAPLLLTQQLLVPELPPHQAQVLCLDTDWATIAQESTANLPQKAVALNSAYVIYTSGSTGKPKGVVISQQALVNFLWNMRDQLALTTQDVMLATTSLSFDIAGLELYLPLLTGAQIVIASREMVTDGLQLAAAIEDFACTILQMTPAGWRVLVDSGWQGRQQMQLLCGGEALSLELARVLLTKGRCLINLYGPTETTIWSALYRVEQAESVIPLGQPIANTQLYILNAALQPVAIGVPGELYIGGDGLARGYLNQPGLTAERFIPHPFSITGGERLYKTGDLACYLPDGKIDFLGRLDYQIKLRGFRIEMGEIETLLDSHPAVRQSVVVVHEDSRGQKRLVAYFVPAQEQSPSIEDLRTHLQLRVPAYMIPATFIPLSELPLTFNGKINRKALPAPDQSTGSDTGEAYLRSGLSCAYVPPGNEVERTMVAIWEEYLNISPIGIHDRFDELGGDSLLILQVISRLYNTFLVRLAIRDFLTDPTIARLATIISQRLVQAFDHSALEQLLEALGP